MAEEKKEPWLNYLALTTVVFAVCATLATFKGGGYSTRSVISQTQASDQWAFFQAKSMKGNLYEIQKEKLELEIATLPTNTAAEIRERYTKTLAEYTERMARYDKEKAEIQAVAKSFEAKRDDAQRHSQPFGIAVIFLQVAILISSIAGLFKRKILWQLALPVGAIGAVYFADGFLLFM